MPFDWVKGGLNSLDWCSAPTSSGAVQVPCGDVQKWGERKKKFELVKQIVATVMGMAVLVCCNKK